MAPDDPPAAGPDDRFQYLVEHLQDAVVEFDIVDGDPVVRAVNPAFVDVFGYEETAVVGASLNDLIVPGWLAAEATALDARTAAGSINYRRVRRQTADGLREFLYRGIPYETAAGERGGFAVYTDLTEHSRRERRLQVVSRILRHNLRNQTTVLEGAAAQLRDALGTVEGAVAENLDRIDDAAASLGSIAAEAGEVQALLDGDAGADPAVDAAAIARTVAASTRAAWPRADVETTAPERARVAASDRLREAVAALAENAVVHNPAADPRVGIAVTTVGAGEWVDVAVADDGPRIPEMDRAVITGEREITQTYHGSGLGLWLVAWTVERFGGDLAFGESRWGGNRVRLRLQRAR
jgi:PAS domain S-box-containing protein